MEYPAKLPLAEKPVWFYTDCFPANMPFKLTSIFCHRNYNMDMHSHDFYEINVVIGGTGVHYTETTSYRVGPGDICIVPPEKRHGYFNGGGLDVFHILLHRNYFSKYSDDLAVLSSFHILFHGDIQLREKQPIPNFHMEGKTYDELLALLYRLDELEQRTMNSSAADRADYLLSYSLTLAVIATFCKEYTRQYARPAKPDSGDIGIVAAAEYIHKNYAGKITLSDLCQIAMMSKTVLSEKFHSYYGLSPAAYINRYRILIAKNALVETDKTIAEIAQETGFFDTSHFLKTYGKYEKETPAQFREGLRNPRRGK